MTVSAKHDAIVRTWWFRIFKEPFSDRGDSSVSYVSFVAYGLWNHWFVDTDAFAHPVLKEFGDIGILP